MYVHVCNFIARRLRLAIMAAERVCTNWVFRVCVLQLWVVSRSEPRLPLLIEDASRPVDETGEVSNSYYCFSPI